MTYKNAHAICGRLICTTWVCVFIHIYKMYIFKKPVIPRDPADSKKEGQAIFGLPLSLFRPNRPCYNPKPWRSFSKLWPLAPVFRSPIVRHPLGRSRSTRQAAFGSAPQPAVPLSIYHPCDHLPPLPGRACDHHFSKPMISYSSSPILL